MFAELGILPQIVPGESGKAAIWHVRPGLVLTQVDGRMVVAQARAVMQAVDEAIRARPGKAMVFHDWTAITSYEVAVHAQMTAWSVKVVRSLARIAIAANSPLVLLALRTANLAVGGRFELVESREQLVAAARAEWARKS